MRWMWTVLALFSWVAVNGAVLVLAPAAVPFDWPNRHTPLTGLSQVIDAQLLLLEAVVLGGVVRLMTRRRADPAVGARVPAAAARREVPLLLGYAVMAQAGGALLGKALGWHPFGFHLAGTLFGASAPVTAPEALGWAAYNATVYALLPFLWFRRRYTADQFCLRSADRRADTRLILVVLALETLVQLAVLGHSFAGLSAGKVALGLPVTFLLYLAGTVLPTMIFVQCLLVPRYATLTGSMPGTLLLGGITYAGLHLAEGWSRFGTPREATLSVLFVLLVYAVPGAVKTLLTVRTGNAWVHAWAYHALAPHTLHDTGLIVRIFKL